MASINNEGREPAGTVYVKVAPDFDGFTEALEKGLRDAEATSPLIAILTRIEDHLRVIARAHQPIAFTTYRDEPSSTKKEN